MRKDKRFPRLLQRIPIRWRLALVSLGLLALLLSAFGIIISAIAERVLVTNQVNVLQNEAQVAWKGAVKSMPPEGRPFDLGYAFFPPGPQSADFNTTALSLLHTINGAGTNASAIILMSDGTLDQGIPIASPSLPAVQIPPEQVQAITQSNNWYLLSDDPHGYRQLSVFIPLTNNFHTVGILQISTSTTFIDNFLTPFRETLLLGIIGAFCLAIALVFPLVSLALKPLVEIERASRGIAQGKLSMRIEQPETDDEIGRLARSFNRMVAQIETAFQRQKRFVADVSHELRTPLTALNGSLEMLLIGADLGDTEASRRLTRGMYSEVQRMQRMVEDLLALTRLDEGKITLRQENIDVHTLLHTVCEQSEHLARGQAMRCEVMPTLPAIRADKDRLQQVLLNLMDNALKFTPSNGRVELMARSTSLDTVEITVRDTGQGISPEALPHVFDRFYRADPSRSRLPRHAGGSGLGLAIAKELIEAQGGHIEIHSIVGEGTTVRILFATEAQPQSVRLLHEQQEPKTLDFKPLPEQSQHAGLSQR